MPIITTLHTRGAVLVEVDADTRLDPAWLTRWRLAVAGAVQHPDDRAEDDGGSWVAARVRQRRAGVLLALAAELE